MQRPDILVFHYLFDRGVISVIGPLNLVELKNLCVFLTPPKAQKALCLVSFAFSYERTSEVAINQ